MPNFTISDSDLESIKGQVVIITGASSGIGLATLRRLQSHGAKVFASDINELPEPERASVPFLKADVSSWKDQVALFKAAKEKYGTIQHVFANAGVTSSFNLLEEEVDENGDLLPPNLKTVNVNLIGVIYSVKLAVQYLRKEGGSIVITGSGSSFSRFSPTDYTTTKHAVLGLIRAMTVNLYPNLPIRINGLAPAWTETNIIPRRLIEALGDQVQSPDEVAKSAILLMADENRHGEFIFSDRGKFWEIDNGENGLISSVRRAIDLPGQPDESWNSKLREARESVAKEIRGEKKEES